MPFFESPRLFKINSANSIDVRGCQKNYHPGQPTKVSGRVNSVYGTHDRGYYSPTSDATTGSVSVIGHGSYAKIVLDRNAVKLNHATTRSNYVLRSRQPYPHPQADALRVDQPRSTTLSPRPLRADNQMTPPDTLIPDTTVINSMSSSSRPTLSVTTLASTLPLQTPRTDSPSTVPTPATTATGRPIPHTSSSVAPERLTPTPLTPSLAQSPALAPHLGATHQEEGGRKRRLHIIMLMMIPGYLFRLFRKLSKRTAQAASA